MGKARFLAELDTLVEVYAAAMRPPREQVPGRRAIMERHTQFPSFRAVVVTAPAGPLGTGDGPGPPPGRASAELASRPAAAGCRSSRSATASTGRTGNGGMTWCAAG